MADRRFRSRPIQVRSRSYESKHAAKVKLLRIPSVNHRAKMMDSDNGFCMFSNHPFGVSPPGTPQMGRKKSLPSESVLAESLKSMPMNGISPYPESKKKSALPRGLNRMNGSLTGSNPQLASRKETVDDRLKIPTTGMRKSKSWTELADRPKMPLPVDLPKQAIPTIQVDPPEEKDNTSKTESESSNKSSASSDQSGRLQSGTSASDSPVFQDDGFFEDSDEEYYGNDNWDAATVVPKERQSAGDSFAGFLKFIRMFMYIGLFLLVLVCAVASMGSLLLLTASLRKNELYRHAARNQLVWIICWPQALVFLISFFKTIFGNVPSPTFKVFFLAVFLELVHTFGLVLIIFHVLPHFGTLYCIGLLNALSILPGILSLFFNGTFKGKSTVRTILIKFLDVLAILVTIAVVTLPLVLKSAYNLRWSSDNESMENGSHQTNMIEEDHLKWQVPLGFVMVSVKWWENFVGLDIGCLKLYELKKAIHNTRNKLNLLTSVFSILGTFVFVWLLDILNSDHLNFKNTYDPLHHREDEIRYECQNLTIEGDRQSDGNDTVSELCAATVHSESPEQYVLGYVPVILCAGCSLIMYYCCGVATKLLMQRFSVALPLLLASPVLAGLALLQCKNFMPEIPITSGMKYEFVCDMDSMQNVAYTVAGAASWVSLLWTTRHVWFPQIERLSHNERIFITRMFTGPLVTQCVLLNRRNDAQDINIVGNAKNEELDVLYRRVHGSSSTSDSDNNKKTDRTTPMIYACATMWHENRNEMVQLLKSVFRMDFDYCARRIAKTLFQVDDPDLYDFETHVFFDDCMELDDDDKWTVNKFVVQLKECMCEAASAVRRSDVIIPPPDKWSTPYGGKLTWLLPGGTNLVVHLKDKNKIRHRKRWSQVMYMYYLLGYRLFGEVPVETKAPITKKDSTESFNSMSTSGLGSETTGLRNRSAVSGGSKKGSSWPQNSGKDRGQIDRFMKSDIFKNMEESLIVKTENTFILALDGDVDFKPDAVRLLVDRMRINPKTGASCGRIHPIGSSPMVWYQKFEYAIGHWFQKSTEHVLGCVLCSPGCFSLFRASALLDDNVMKRYTTEPTEPGHYLQYDQGEDRWLCTLLLQQGYRVDYAAASDALTYAPETFDEFFNQRRRWTPSTMANIIDLLSSSANTILVNPNISLLYIFYQFVLMISTILGPATIILAIASAFKGVFGWKLWECYLASMAPVIFYLIICFKCKTKTQLLIGAFLSVMYACVMTVVLVGIIQSIVIDNILNPSLLFLVVVVGCFGFAGLIHPYEFTVLLHGILYFLCIPAGYLVLMIYSMCNLHNVSWGTREIPKRKSKAQQAAEAAAAANAAKNKQTKGGWFSGLKLDAFYDKLTTILTQALNKKKDNTFQENMGKMMKRQNKLMKRMIKQQKIGNGQCVDSDSSDEEKETAKKEKEGEKYSLLSIEVQQTEKIVVEEVKLDDTKNPNWIKDPRLGLGERRYLDNNEEQFWHQFIRRYLKPLKKDAAKEKQLASELILLRNNSAFGFWFVNFLWVLFNYMIQKDSVLSTIRVGSLTTEPIGFVFLIFFLLILTLQLIGMIIHRWGTLLQLIAITQITNMLSKAFTHGTALMSFKTSQNAVKSRPTTEKLVRMISNMQHAEPDPDYPSDGPDDDEAIYSEVETFVGQKKRKDPKRNHDEIAIDIEPRHRDHMSHLNDLMMNDFTPLRGPSHQHAVKRRLRKNIMNREMNRGHRTRHRGNPDRGSSPVSHRGQGQTRLSVEPPGHHQSRRSSVDLSYRDARRKSTDHSAFGYPSLNGSRSPDRRRDNDHRSPHRREREHQGRPRYQPRYTQDHPLLERQFFRQFHRMASKHDNSRV